MDDIVKLYNEHLTTSFPDRRGDEVMGIDLVLIDSDTAGLISAYIGSRGQLKGKDYKILKRCYIDLKTVIAELNGVDRQYFARLRNITGLIIDAIQTNTIRLTRNLINPSGKRTS